VSKLIFCAVGVLALAGCQSDQKPYTRECVTTSGEHFFYLQSPREALAEEYRTIVNRYGVYDTDGWYRDEDSIATCRDRGFDG
jgi:hypothetical protein